jgi:hypothetical protein
VRRYIPVASFTLFWVALDVSDVHNNSLSAIILAGVVVLLLYGAWPGLRRVRHGDLRVTALEERWDNFQYLGFILEAKLRIENLTGHRKRVVSQAVTFEGARPPTDMDIRREVERRKHNVQQLHASVIDPHDTVSGWMLFCFDDAGDHDSYKFQITDELNKTYYAKRPPWFVRWFA